MDVETLLNKLLILGMFWVGLYILIIRNTAKVERDEERAEELRRQQERRKEQEEVDRRQREAEQKKREEEEARKEKKKREERSRKLSEIEEGYKHMSTERLKFEFDELKDKLDDAKTEYEREKAECDKLYEEGILNPDANIDVVEKLQRSREQNYLRPYRTRYEEAKEELDICRTGL